MTRLRSSTSTATLESPFLHLKFLEGRPPDFAARHAFAHELALAPGETALPEGLRTDVQREGIARYLVNNFKDGSPVHGIIHERVRDSSYIMVNSNWHRSSGDSKLHLSLYIYKKDRHIDTWHAYTDRSLSLTRSATSTQVGTAAYSTPETIAHKSLSSYQPKPSRADEEQEERRPFRPAAAPVEESEDQGAFAPPVKKSSSARRRDTSESEEEEEEEDGEQLKIPHVVPSREEESPSPPPLSPTHEPRSSNPHSRAPTSHHAEPTPSSSSSRVSRRLSGSRSTSKLDPPAQPKTDDWDAPPPEDDRPRSDDEEEGWIKPPPKGENAVEGFEKMFTRSGGERERSRSQREEEESDEEQEKAESTRKEEKRSSRHGIVPSKPIGRSEPSRSQRRHSSSRSRSPSPPSPATSHSRHKSRDSSPPRSPSSPPPKERSPSPPPASARGRGRQAHSTTLRRDSSSRSRSPARPRSPSAERSPSPPSKSARQSSRHRQASRSPSPKRESSLPRQRTASRARRAIEKEEEVIKEEVRHVKTRLRDRSRSRSRSPSPPPAAHRHSHASHRQEKRQERSRSRTPSPPPTHRRRSSPTRSEKSSSRSKPPSAPPSLIADPAPPKKSHRRTRSLSPAADAPAPTSTASKRSSSRARRPRSPSSPPASPAVEPKSITRKPSFRSVRRSPYPKDYDDEEDVLGDLDDSALDIPGGGETEVIRASRRESRKSRTYNGDGSFVPEEMKKEASTPAAAMAPTAAATVSGWFKGVGEFIKAKTVAVAAEVEPDEPEEEDEEATMERRRARRERRRKRREAGRATDAEGTDAEGGGRRRRREPETDVETEVEEKPKRSSRRAKEDEEPPKSPIVEPKSSRKTAEERPSSSMDDRPSRRRQDEEDSRSAAPEERPRRRHESPPSSPTESRSSRRPKDPAPRSLIHDESSRRSRARQEARPIEEQPTSPSSPPARPLRHGAMSISASVDAGLRGIRDTVTKAVAARVEATEAQVAADLKEQEDRMLKPDKRDSRSSRQRGGETDTEEPPRSGRREEQPLEEESRARRRRGSAAATDVEDAGPPPRSRRRAPSVAVTDGEKSDASTRSRRRQRSDSEGDTDAHRLAKANASVNSTTILPEELASRARQVVPPSPSSNHPRSVREELRLKAEASRASPKPSSSRSERVAQDIRRLKEEVLDIVQPHKHDAAREKPSRSRRDHSRAHSSSDEDFRAPPAPRSAPTSSRGPSRASRDDPSPTSARRSPPSAPPPATVGYQSLRGALSPNEDYMEQTRPIPTFPNQSLNPVFPSAHAFAHPQQQPLAPIPIMPRQSFPSHPPNFPGPPPVGYVSSGPPLARPEPIRPSPSFGLPPSAPAPSMEPPEAVRQRAKPQNKKTYSDSEVSEEEVQIGGGGGRRGAPSTSHRQAPSTSHRSTSSYQLSHTTYDLSDSDSSSAAAPLAHHRPPPSRADPQSSFNFPIPAAPTANTFAEDGTLDSDSSVDQRRRERVQSFSRSAPSFEPFSDGGESEGYALPSSRRKLLAEEKMSSGQVGAGRGYESSDEEAAPPAPAPNRSRTIVSSVSGSSAGGSMMRDTYGRSGPSSRAPPVAYVSAPRHADVASPSPTSLIGGFGREDRRERRERAAGGGVRRR